MSKETPSISTALPAIKEMMEYRDIDIAMQIRRDASASAGILPTTRVLDITNSQLSRFMGLQDQMLRSYGLEPYNTEEELRDIARLAQLDPDSKFLAGHGSELLVRKS